MKLLIVTQTVDENDPVLGFFCRWIEEFAKRFESISVIALNVGTHHLPANVSVYPLGKNEGAGRLRRFFRYLTLLVKLKKDYTHVLAHMNPEYVIAGAPVWLTSEKKVALWYNHTQKSFRLSLAAHLVRVVFHTSLYAASAGFAWAKRMPAGIDTELFKPQNVKKDPFRAYFQGRVAPAKRVADICQAVRTLRFRGVSATLMVVGPEDPKYGERLRTEYADLLSDGALSFGGKMKNSETPSLFNAVRVSINLTAPGNYDKTVLESMACGTPAIVSSKAFADMIPEEWIIPEHDTDALARKMEGIFALPEEKYRALGESLRSSVVKKHGIKHLADELATSFRSL